MPNQISKFFIMILVIINDVRYQIVFLYNVNVPGANNESENKHLIISFVYSPGPSLESR